jgi:hypothetical protein
MAWLVGGVWIGVVVLGALVLGFCAYELVWKARRLQTDLERLAALSETVSAMQAEVERAQVRFAAVAAATVER